MTQPAVTAWSGNGLQPKPALQRPVILDWDGQIMFHSISQITQAFTGGNNYATSLWPACYHNKTLYHPCESRLCRRSSLIIPCVQLVEIPTWFRFSYKNFGCAEPLLSWLQREKRVSVSSISQDARSWPIYSRAHRARYPGEGAHTHKRRRTQRAFLFSLGPAAVEVDFSACLFEWERADWALLDIEGAAFFFFLSFFQTHWRGAALVLVD